MAKAKIIVERTKREFEVLFNPEEYSLNRDNNFASHSVPGLSSPLLQFAHGNLQTLEMELLFDTYERQGDVRDVTKELLKLMDIDPELHAPPVLVVQWASLQFRCVMSRANQKFLLFLPDGRPVRARINVTFQEYVDPSLEPLQVGRMTADFTKVHVVKQGETIDRIAAERYDNPLIWRVIAVANRLDDPRALKTGQELVVPSLPFFDPETGVEVR
jgi:nucleoid-associated protein YgaU